MPSHMNPLPPPLYPGALEPGRIKVFGIIHTLFGVLGVINVVGALGWLVFHEQIMGFTNAGGPPELMAAQEKFHGDLAPHSWISLVISFIVSLLILRAGIALLKRRRSAVRVSNTYAVASLLAKVVGALLFFVMVMPVANGALDTVLGEGIPEPDVEAILAGARIAMVVGGVVFPLIGAIYPLCSILMLNNPPVKEFLGENGT